MRRLALRLPTVLQLEGPDPFLFHEGGVSKLTDLQGYCYQRKLKQDDKSNRIWALVASPEPANIFKSSSPFFVVLVACPLSNHQRWLNKIRYRVFYMKPWSISEVLQAYVDLDTAGSQHSLFL